MAVRLCPGVHVVKIISSGIIVVSLGALCVAGSVFFNNRVTTPSLKLRDLCPNEKRDPIIKTRTEITRSRRSMVVLHELLGFRFLIPDGGFRYEENTLQDYEEPIALPHYLYSMYFSYPGTRDIYIAPPVEMKFVVYPTLCNTSQNWMSFLERQGWSRLSEDEVKYPHFIVLEKKQSGRTYRRYFRHDGSRHYEFDLSWDASSTYASEGLRKADVTLESFSLIHEKERF